MHSSMCGTIEVSNGAASKDYAALAFPEYLTLRRRLALYYYIYGPMLDMKKSESAGWLVHHWRRTTMVVMGSGLHNASQPEPIILYDIPSRTPIRCWSPNVWKVRLVLNLKKIPYETVWIQYPEIGPLLRSAKVPPNDRTTFPYTLPAIRFPDGEVVMDSAEIVRRLDHLQPTPGLRLESDLISRVDTVFDRIYAVADRLYLYGVPALLLSEPSTSHFLEDRKKMLGIDVESYAAQKSGDDIYDGVVPYIRTLGTILRENSSGPFCLGDEASYADIIIVSWMKFWLRLGVLERMIQSDPFPLSTLLTVFAQFLARDHL